MISLKQILFFSFAFVSHISGEPTNSNEIACQKSLKHCDNIVAQLTAKSPLHDRDDDRLKAYLYYAQKNFVEAIFAKNDLYPNNVNYISLHVIQLFYPNYQKTIASDLDANGFTLKLQSAVDQRFKEEQANIHPISLPKKKDSWIGKIPYHGIEIPTWKPWVLTSASEFRLPPPPPPSDSSFWDNQLRMVKEAMAKASDPQKQRILFWANMLGTGSGDWFYMLNQYMNEAKVPLMTQLKIRDIVGKTIVDATIAAFDSKYTYLVRRPDMLDPNLKTYIKTPNHPSFPSAHSTVCYAVLEVLNHYLPENSSEWQRLVEEAGMSRIWAGIHFPIDHEAGKKLGKKVGQAVLNNP